jgi:hypothetical protein
MSREPFLSVVVTTRNDDHGGDPLKRLQAFVNCFEQQCRRTGLDAEVIVVEWNPPADRPRVASLLRTPPAPIGSSRSRRSSTSDCGTPTCCRCFR